MLNESLRVANNQLAARNTELQSQIADRVSAELRLLEVNRRKDEFLATLAHELRNPLASLGNALNALQLAERSRSAARSDAAPVEAAGAPDRRPARRRAHQPRQADRAARADDAARDSRFRDRDLDAARAPPIGTVWTCACPTRVALYADHDRLSQVFSNLLNNAAKYSPGDTPIELVARASHGSVSSRGHRQRHRARAGQADEIFEAFAQIDTSLERSRGGLGIGLTLVKRIVELHGGHVAAHSEGPRPRQPVQRVPAARADSGDGVGARRRAGDAGDARAAAAH